MNELDAHKADITSNIFTDPAQYRIHYDGIGYLIFNPIYCMGKWPSEKAATDFIYRRTHPVEIPARVYADICRCGAMKKDWDYYITNGLVFERCNLCNQPLRHNVMVEINRDLIKNFDLDEFLGL